MSLFDFIFGKKDLAENEPSVVFGRFSDSFKPTHKYKSWDQALSLYNEGQFHQSFICFLEYLKSDIHDNVRYTQSGNDIAFSIFQGSKKIEGTLNTQKLFVEAKIAKTYALHVGFMRRLIEDNYLLKYGRYALDEDDNITIVFDSIISDISPYRLYYAFKELAIHADKLDDVLVDEFEDLDVINVEHIRAISQEEKTTKSTYVLESIRDTLDHIQNSTLDIEQYPGAVSFLLLGLSYRLDYFVKPEGFVMEQLERIHQAFFNSKETSAHNKNEQMIALFSKILEREQSSVEAEMYEVLSSFGVTAPVSVKQLSEFIKAELHHMDWYEEEGHTTFAMAIPDYIVGYALFNYGLSKPVADLFHLYYQIRYPDFFTKLGYQSYKISPTKFDIKKIKRAIKNIVDDNIPLYPFLLATSDPIDYSNGLSFARSFLIMIADLDLSRADHKEVQ